MPRCRCRNGSSVLLSQDPVLPIFDYLYFTDFSDDLETWFSYRLLPHLVDSVLGTDRLIHQTTKDCRGALSQRQLHRASHAPSGAYTPSEGPVSGITAACSVITLPARWTKRTGTRKPLQHRGKLDVSYLAYPFLLGVSNPAFKTATDKAPLRSN